MEKNFKYPLILMKEILSRFSWMMAGVAGLGEAWEGGTVAFIKVYRTR